MTDMPSEETSASESSATRDIHRAQALKSVRNSGTTTWVPAGIALALAGVASYGSLAFIAPNIRQQSYDQALANYENAEAATRAQVNVISGSIAKLQHQLNQELASIQSLSNASPPSLNPGGGTSGSSATGSIPNLPPLAISSVSVPTTHATTGASTTAG